MKAIEDEREQIQKEQANLISIITAPKLNTGHKQVHTHDRKKTPAQKQHSNRNPTEHPRNATNQHSRHKHSQQRTPTGPNCRLKNPIIRHKQYNFSRVSHSTTITGERRNLRHEHRGTARAEQNTIN